MRERGGSNIPTREIEIVVPKIAHASFGSPLRGLFPSPRETFLSLSFFRVFTFFSPSPKKRAFLFASGDTRASHGLHSLSPSLEHRQTLKADINHAVSCIFRLSFSLVRSALLFLERTNARRFRFLVNCKKVAHFAFHMRTFPNAH